MDGERGGRGRRDREAREPREEGRSRLQSELRDLRELRELRIREGSPYAGQAAAARVGEIEERRRIRLDQPRSGRRRWLRLPAYDPEAFGRLSEQIARFLGTGRFIVWMTVVVVIWVGWNSLVPITLRFDQYPFIFLTLALSLQASYAAPLILLAQNRQADRDRVNMEQDRARGERNIADTEFLTREVAALRQGLGEVATRDFLRSELQALVKELDGQRRELAPRVEDV